ncbi:MAG: hypothetical protein JEY94_01565 [Melioribacteraceae bacterium]|nr:hypothetical protein [Melioribacteraceae bacterium]
MKKAVLFSVLILFAINTVFAQEKKIGDEFDGSRTHPVHNIKLLDHSGLVISKNDLQAMPFSTKETCGGKCHNYDVISNGFHFNFDNPEIKGRKGEPWIYSDASILTNIPLSFRGWDGTYKPSEMGVSNLSFLKRFGPYYAGGDLSELDSLEHSDNYFRWQVSGKMSTNCLICHDADPYYDKAEYASNMRKENFSWAASASSSLTEFKGNASKMPDNYDPFNTTSLLSIDMRSSSPPSVEYDKTKFDKDEKVNFNITRKVPNERCYYCHSTKVVDSQFEHGWKNNEDVHITSGLNCIDCHKNGLDHNIIRGNSKENSEESEKYTCEGCHNESGLLGAPRPIHAGLPTVHFEKLACTTCHSGAIGKENTEYVKTARNHFMGMQGSTKHGNQFPHIQTVVLTENDEGKIEPGHLVWPVFWGVKSDSAFSPLDIKIAEEIVRPMLGLDTLYNFGEWPKLSDSLITAVLDSLNNIDEINGEASFYSSGNKYSVSNKQLIKSENEKAAPYTWPIAHNVRPALQSLGKDGCSDCHSIGSDFFNKYITVESSLLSGKETFLKAADFENRSSIYQNIFSLTFFFRPALKIIIIISTVLILILLVAYSGNLLKKVSANNLEKKD